MRILRVLLAVVVVAGMGSKLAWAQSPQATISGWVRDGAGKDLGEATVALEGLDTGWKLQVKGQQQGRYVLPLVPPGRYRLTASRDGFAPFELSELTLEGGQELELDLVLQPPQFQAQALVESLALLVEAGRSDRTATVRGDTVRALPVDSRDILNLALLSPGVVPGRRGVGYQQIVEVGIGAGYGHDSSVEVDGGSANDPFLGYGLGLPPVEATEQFQLATGRHGAELGGGSAGTVQVVTRHGTNELQGSALILLRDGSLDGSSPYTAQDIQDTLSRQQFALTLGGPLSRDRAHFFAAYEGSRADETQIVDTAGSRPELEGPLPIRATVDNALARLDLAASPQHALTGRHSFYRLRNTNFPFTASSQLYTESARSGIEVDQHSLLLSDAWSIGENAHNQLRVQLLSARQEFAPNSTTEFELRPSSLSGTLPFLPVRKDLRRLQVANSFLLQVPDAAGIHFLTLGAEMQLLDFGGSFSNYGRGALLFQTDEPFDPLDPTTYPTTRLDGSFGSLEHSVQQWSLHLQDDWTPLPRLTLNLALRYDLEAGSLNSNVDNPVPYLKRPALDTNNISPRLGLAWDATGDGATVLRAGAGRYYTRVYGWLFDARSGPGELRITLSPGYQGRENPLGSVSFTSQSYLGTDPDIRQPYTDQLSLGVDRQLGRHWAASADLVAIRGRDEILRLESNPIDPSTGQRPHPELGSVPVYSSAGSSRHAALELHLRSRGAAWGSLGIAYTLARTRNDHNFFLDNFESRAQLDASEGASLNDTRHRLAVHGAWNLPWKLELGGVVMLSSAQPFDVNSGKDENGDGILDRPSGFERNSQRGDSYSRIDLRLSRSFHLGRIQVEPLLETYNLLDTLNVDPDTIVGNQLSPLLGQGGSTLNPLYQPRQVQLGLRFSY